LCRGAPKGTGRGASVVGGGGAAKGGDRRGAPSGRCITFADTFRFTEGRPSDDGAVQCCA